MNRHFLLRRNLARAVLRLGRWRTEGTVPDRAILVGAPHTSNWDWVVTMLLAWDSSATVHLLVKKELFKGPVGWILRASGAVALDRANPRATIEDLMAQAASSEDPFLLGIAAEGKRGRSEYWKSGFYRIAQQTHLPITLAFLDASKRRTGWGPTFHPSGDIAADMDLVRAFYADKRGFHPELFTPPRLRDES